MNPYCIQVVCETYLACILGMQQTYLAWPAVWFPMHNGQGRCYACQCTLALCFGYSLSPWPVLTYNIFPHKVDITWVKKMHMQVMSIAINFPPKHIESCLSNWVPASSNLQASFILVLLWFWDSLCSLPMSVTTRAIFFLQYNQIIKQQRFHSNAERTYNAHC